MNHPCFEEIKCKNAEELWDKLSPARPLAEKPHHFIYRGQGNADWPLVPSILRKGDNNPLSALSLSAKIAADDQVGMEIILLKTFAEYCDSAGIKLPNDSIELRETVLNPNRADRYIKQPALWPSEDVLEVMAFAQHHHVPTRLLDWTKIPYVAAYFAASAAIREILLEKESKNNKELAIWALNTESLTLYRDYVKLLCVPSSVSPYLAAQRGCFTVQYFIFSVRGQPLKVTGLEEVFSHSANTPLIKLTLPIKESVQLFYLCDKAGFSGAAMYPSTDGAGNAVMDIVCAEKAKKLLDSGSSPE